MKKILNYLFACTLLVVSCKAKSQRKEDSQPKTPKNILFIAVDDLRPELNFYGAHHISSPNLDKLAGESMVFNRAYCNVPVCGASRASLLTGTRPTRYRFLDARTQKDADYPEAISLPLLLKQNGFATISNGKIYHNGKDDNTAWDSRWFPKENVRDYLLPNNAKEALDTGYGPAFEAIEVTDSTYFDGKIAQKGIEDLRHLQHGDQPFFLALGFMKPHLPFNAPKKYWDLYDRNKIELPENYVQPETTPKQAFHKFGELRKYSNAPDEGEVSQELAKELIHGYYACVSYVDAQIGLVLDELRRLELEDDTIVILWGDHGWNLGDHKLWCKHVTFESSLRTPLMIKVPGTTSGQTTDAITEYIDIYPSLAELVGLEVPKTVQGQSFVPLLNGEPQEKDWAVAKFKDAVTLIKGDLFYTEWTKDDGVAYARMLFDHKTDPLELNNLAELPEYQETVSLLAEELREKWGEDFLQKN